MQVLFIVLIVIFLFGIIGIVYVSNYNNLQYKKTKIEQAEGLIDEVLRKRYDIVSRTSEIIKTNLKEKKDYLKEYVQLKDEKISNFDLDRKLKEAINIIQNLKNDYPELQNNPNIKEIVIEIQDTEEKLSAAIAYYNRYTNKFNELVRKFPSNVIAKFHHFKVKQFFDGKDMTDDDLLDFKL